MISKLLVVFETGLRALRLHTKFVFIILVLFLLPLLILHIEESSTAISMQNIKTAEKEVVGILHDSLKENVATENFFTTSQQYKDELSTPTNFFLFAQETEGEYQLSTSTLVDDKEFKIDEFVLATTPENGDLFIFESESAGNRIWYAASKIKTEGRNLLILTVHDYSNTDAVFAKRSTQMYWPIGLGFLFILSLVYWLIRQTNWEAKYEEQKSILKEQELLVTTITHEFRAPLTAIRGYSSFLGESNRLRPRDLENLSNLDMSTNRLIHLVNDFLEVAKLQAGTLDINSAKVSVCEVVYRVLGALGSSAAEKQLTIRDATQNKEILLVTDQFRLEQILTNIVSNAIKYTERGSVVITYEKNPLYLTIRVQDTGSGISAEDQAKLFKPFSRVGGVEKTEIVGSGLGMWITKKLVTRLGGGVTIESIQGVGTHVVIKFDLRKIASMTREGIL